MATGKTAYFKQLVDAAPDGEKAPIRALQAWQYLIGCAASRRIIRYDELRELMEYPTNNPLRSILGCIMFYCEQNGLPPLTIIVVNQPGVPGEGFTAEPLERYHERRERVFNHPWFRMVPPAPADFRQSLTLGGAAKADDAGL